MRRRRFRRTKIVATLGPASDTPNAIERLIRAGLDIARLNLSHGTRAEHARYAAAVRAAGRRLGKRVALLVDLPGPKYRVGQLKDGAVTLKRGDRITLATHDGEGDAGRLPVNLPSFVRDVRRGDTVLLDDGALRLKVVEARGDEVVGRVMAGGVLRERRGIAIPGRPISAPFLTDALRDDIAFALAQGADWLALSFVRSADDVAQVRSIVREHQSSVPLVAKIERVEAVSNFDAILAASDAVMVARGDLGVDIPLERVPLVQKEIIGKCNRAGKPVITATQMLESMVNSPGPTRAETTDVANAIFDGTDATMLSGETAIGKYPVASVRMMARIAGATERKLDYARLLNERGNWVSPETDEMIAYSAVQAAHRLGAAAIVALTSSGSTAGRVAKYRPQAPILALTPGEEIANRLLLYRGVLPVYLGTAPSLDELLAAGVRAVREAGLGRPGDLIAITGGIPLGVAGGTNLLKVERIG